MLSKWVGAGGYWPGLCLFGLLWAASVAAVYGDLRRRWLPRSEQIAWLALAALVPGLGFLAYLLFRALGRAFPLPSKAPAERSKKRVTLLRPVPEAAPRTGTIAASDLIRETVVERPVAPPRGVTLAVIAGPHARQVLAAQGLPVRLGRGGEAALRLDRDQGVSREHAEIYWQAGALRIRDLGSSHGTSVNGQRIQNVPLALGDKIEVGLSTLVVKETE
ncbi:MAG TPA: FHA domain-containing protein [Chloroflexia bacterium]|nr:FHA domain-containing protein [Chloroflexia bacterium]